MSTERDLVLPANFAVGPTLVHSDAGRTHKLTAGGRSRPEILDRHTANLVGLAEGRDIWVPTFNYDFLRSGIYRVESDPSQVGPIGEYLRTSRTQWRTEYPVFNIAGTGEEPSGRLEDGATIDPFDNDSLFGVLTRLRGSILWYGAPMSSSTIIHHAERVSGGPLYRYDKLFPGAVVGTSGEAKHVTLRYHVRPWGQTLEYDWHRLESDLRAVGLISEIEQSAFVNIVIAADLVNFWMGRLRDDPLYLLDAQSREWVSRKLDVLGRRFQLGDFEDVSR